MNKTTLNSQKEKHSTLSLRRATKERKVLIADVYIFRSTLSLRRATRSRGSPRILVRDFYPRSPCGERLAVFFLDLVALAISIHALLAESDPAYHGRVAQLDYFYPRSPCGERLAKGLRENALTANFYPRSPCGERPCTHCIWHMCNSISIHALLAESDSATGTRQLIYTDFYPRSPCGERLWRGLGQRPRLADFYPRSPCGERHAARLPRPAQILISIHALLAESDALVAGFATLYANFYPRSPCGERPAQIIVSIQNIRISIHALLAESDFRAWAWLTP